MKKFKVVYKYVGINDTIIDAINADDAREIFKTRINSIFPESKGTMFYGKWYDIKILSITEIK
jgi:hypothetical protein